jgi:endonuclease/exonuclease/phosphatase family metal-dependent hydrolase
MKSKAFFFLFLVMVGFSVWAQPLRVMTFNIRLDHEGDGQHNWRYRKVEASKLLIDKSIDIVGTQEVLKNQLDDLLQGAPEFAAVGVGRFDGKEAGEYSAILYRKDKFLVEESGNFWLSESPEIAGSKGWDAACERIVTWARFKDIETGKRFVFLNTHFDHVGVKARKNSALLLAKKAEIIAGGLPVILSGDFNGEPNSEPVEIIRSSGWLFDSGSLTDSKKGPVWSFHDFGRLPENERPLIDFIFLSAHFQVDSYENIFESFGNTYYSDHNPIIVQLRFKE